MLIKQVIELIDILDSPSASGAAVEQYLRAIDPQANIEVYALQGPREKRYGKGAHPRQPGQVRRRQRPYHRSAGPSGRSGRSA